MHRRLVLHSVPAVYFSNETGFHPDYFYHSCCAEIVVNWNHELAEHPSAASQAEGLAAGGWQLS